MVDLSYSEESQDGMNSTRFGEEFLHTGTRIGLKEKNPLVK
jgi:hypothetical protein